MLLRHVDGFPIRGREIEGQVLARSTAPTPLSRTGLELLSSSGSPEIAFDFYSVVESVQFAQGFVMTYPSQPRAT